MAANYQNMAGVGGNQMMMQSHNQQLQQGPNIQQMLISSIQNQQLLHPTGWQANVGVPERYAQVWHIVSQLRLLSPAQQDLQKICQMALHYEKHSFETQPDKENYMKMIKDKLETLTTARNQTGINQAQLQAQAQANAQRQAQAQQMNMVNQNGMPGHMQRAAMGQQPQQPFLHLQHQMQASGLPPQQQQQQQPGSMGMINNGLPPNMVAQQQQQQQQPQQPQQFQMPIQTQQSQHQMQPDNGRGQFQGLTQQEMTMVSQLTQKLMANASEEDKDNIRQNLRGRMDQVALQRYQSQGMDPLILYYRNQAVNRLRQEKARHAQMSGQLQQPSGMQGIMNTPSAVAMQQQRSGNSSMMNGQAQQQPQIGTNPDFGNFLGGMDNLLGQQQQQPQQGGGLQPDLSQIGGSASVPQGNSTPQTMQGLGGQQTGANGQRPLSNPNFRAQQAFNVQQNQERMNQAGQSQAQIRANAQAKAQQQMALHGQPGGMGPMPPQQSPAMSTLNAPLRTPQQPQPAPPIDPLQMNQPSTVHFGQPIDPRFAQIGAQRTNQASAMAGMGLNGPAPVFPASMPLDYRQKLVALPKDKLNEVIMKWNANHQVQGAKPQAPMAVNVPGARPNQPVPQGGPFNQQNMPNQFMNTGQGGQPPPHIIANMNSQQQMMLRQRMAQQQSRPNMQSAISPGEQQAMIQIDHLEFPQSILAANNFLRQAPQEVKRWGELKLWVSQNPIAMQANLLEIVKGYQRMHYQQIVRARQNANAQTRGLSNAPVLGQPQPAPPMIPPGMAPVAPMVQAQVSNATNPLAGIQISQEDIQKARAHQSGKWANLSDDEIKQMILTNALVQRQRTMQAQQMMGQMPQQLQPPQPQPQPQGQRTPQQVPQRPQNANQTPKQNNRSQQGHANVPPANAQQQPAAPDQVAPIPQMGRVSKVAQATRANQAASSSQPPKNNLKRASSDDIVEVPNPNLQPPARSNPQQPTNQQRPLPQGRPQITSQQFAAMTPDQKKQYQLTVARNQANMLRGNPADIQKCTSIMQEEASKMEPLQVIPMTPQVKQNLSNRLIDAGKNLKKVKLALPKWFAITHDENKLRLFCRTYYKISVQFYDQEMEKLKDSFSINSTDVDASYSLARSMIQDITNQFPNLSKSATGAPTTGAPQPAAVPVKDTAVVQTAPLNAANLQQQQQALKQLNQGKSHSRSSNRNAPPPAPTVAQPPPFPTDALPPTLTQDQLRLPRKKQKQSATSTPLLGQQTASSTAAQTMKAVSPESIVQQLPQPMEPEKSAFLCPEAYCDHHFLDPFEDQAALDKHREEEHVRPIRDPVRFALGELAPMLGLDETGTPIKPQTATLQASGGAGSSTALKSETTPTALGVTSMGRQASINGVKASLTNSLSSKTIKPDEAKDGTQQDKNDKQTDAAKALAVEVNLWTDIAVNPQDLMHNFQHLETGAGGAISDMSVYRSITPNDTPESSKDGISEPNSDISEGLDLNINLDWQPFGPSEGEDFMDFCKINANPDEEMGGLFGDENSQFVPWNDFMDQSAFDKPFVFDASLFSMNAE